MNKTYYCPVCGYDQWLSRPLIQYLFLLRQLILVISDVGHNWSELPGKIGYLKVLRGSVTPFHARLEWNALEQLQKLAESRLYGLVQTVTVTKTTKVVIKRPLAAA